MTAEELVSGLLKDEHKRELLARAVQEAARTADERQIVGLARAFVTGALAEDQAVVDDAMIALETIGQLGAPHWRLITVLLGPSPVSGLDHSEEKIIAKFAKAWRREEILAKDPGLEPVIDALVSKLVGIGLATDVALGTWDYKARWELTAFGHTCATYMRLLGHNHGTG